MSLTHDTLAGVRNLPVVLIHGIRVIDHRGRPLTVSRLERIESYLTRRTCR